MIYGGRSIRAFRPSMVAYEEQYEQDIEVKEANLRIYEERVRAGLPLFETDGVSSRHGANRVLAG